MTNYFETIRQNLASQDKVLRDGTLTNIVNDSVVPVEVTNDLMALCLTNEDLREAVLLNCETFPKNERTIELLLQWADQLDTKTKKFVQLFLENTPATIIAANEKELKDYVSKNTLDFAKKLASFDGLKGEAVKPLWKEYKKLLTQLAQSEKMTLFKKAAQIQDVLIQCGEFNEAIIQQILKEELRRIKLTAKGILAVRAVGVLKLTDYISQLTPLLSRQNEEVLLSVVVDSLIKLNSDEVVQAIEPFVLNENLFYDAISILKEIRTPESERALISALRTNPEVEIQESLISALMSQLSKAFLPFVDEYLPTIEQSDLPEYEEMFYLYFQSMNETHAKLEGWYAVAKENNELQHAEIANTSFSDAIREEEGKVGRNDPCVCGSGKKFKKCCGKEA